MGQLKIIINERSYDVACEDGQEQRLREVAGLLGEKVDQLTSSLGQIGESRLLLMAGLLIADELFDTKAALKKTTKTGGVDPDEVNSQLSELFDQLSGRLENMAEKLDGKS